MTMGTIYALAHPRTNEVRYIGQTIQAIDARCAQHWYARKRLRSRVTSWVKSLDQRPIILALDESVPLEDLDRCERDWIARCRDAGVRLVNLEAGGNHTKVVAVVTRQKMRDAWTAERRAQQAERLRSIRTGVPLTDEAKAKMRATRAGYRHSLETRRKIGAAHRVVTDAMRLEILRLHDEVGLSWREVGIHVGIKASTCANVKRCLRKEGESD